MPRLIIDTDPGVDDAHAIMMAFAYPDAQIEALTTVAGNVSLEKTTANTCFILDVLEQKVPVYAGCDRALVARNPDASYFHGDDGLGDSGYPRSKRVVAEEHAVNALVRLANESPGELTLVAIGPPTNLALATRLDPDLPEKYKRLVVMGGSIHGTGNVTPTAEFNAYTDPEAVAIVFDAWPGLTLISWETTVHHGFTVEQVEILMAMDSPRGEFFRRITRHIFEYTHQVLGRRGMFAPDGIAVAVALEPNIVRKSESHYVQVELAGQHTRSN
ncbi:MAG: nucleoside hydrolase [Anaerolineales bacterium]|nr:nucleoside hydrolase [Anaerolineales bacterium]